MYLGAFLFLFMGFILSLIGAGGAILTLPVLIYIIHLPVFLATTYSLFIVGITAAFGVLLRIKHLAFKEVLIVAIPSCLGVMVARALILPRLPATLFYLTAEHFLLLLLSMLMLMAAFLMLKPHNPRLEIKRLNRLQSFTIEVQAFFLGILMGLIGTGGGFLFLPLLVLRLGIPMRQAIGTSLLIITINATIGFLADRQELHQTDHHALIFYAFFSLMGMAVGTYLSRKIQSRYLKEIFAFIIAIVAIGILVNLVIMH